MRITLEEVKDLRITRNQREVTRMEWDEFIKSHPNGNYFQSPDAFDFFSGAKGFKPHPIFALRNETIIGVLQAILIREPNPKGFFSRRCIVWGGPIVADNNRGIASILIERLNRDVSKTSIFTEFRNLFDTEPISESILKNGFIYEDEANYIVEVNQSSDPIKLLNESKRRQVKKSLDFGAKVIEAQSIKQVQDYYEILSALYKEKVKKPLPDLQFFERFFNFKMSGRIFLVMYEDRVIGGITSPVYKDTIFELYVCGLDKAYRNIYPSVLATWAPIYYAHKEGLRFFDFMGAGKPDEYYGVRNFKSQFGGGYVKFGRYKRINQRLMYKVGEVGLVLNQFFG